MCRFILIKGRNELHHLLSCAGTGRGSIKTRTAVRQGRMSVVAIHSQRESKKTVSSLNCAFAVWVPYQSSSIDGLQFVRNKFLRVFILAL